MNASAIYVNLINSRTLPSLHKFSFDKLFLATVLLVLVYKMYK